MRDMYSRRGCYPTSAGTAIAAVLVAAVLLLACAEDPTPGTAIGDGSLGTVEVEAGAAIQIRSVNNISGDVARLGVTKQRGVELALADYGPVHGFVVSMGIGMSDGCSADGGRRAAESVASDPQVIGVIGTSCSSAATTAAPILAGAGMVMISPSNTSPALTSDLAGTVGQHHHPGYYRTSHNDLYQGQAVARFLFEELEATTAAALHDRDPYTQGLAEAFAAAFENLGGTVTGVVDFDRDETDLVPVLTEAASGEPQALFLPLTGTRGRRVMEQAAGVAGLEDTVLLAADALFEDDFMRLAGTVGMYFSGPDLRYGSNENQSTGRSATEVLATYEETYGESPVSPFWAHAYDATTLLLDAIAVSSYVTEDGVLVIDRAGVRAALNAIERYHGLIGTISCDQYGDCGTQKITVIHHTDANDIEASKRNVVFEFSGS